MTTQFPTRLLLQLLLLIVLPVVAGRATAQEPGFEFAPRPAWVEPLEVPDGHSIAPDSDGTRYLLVSDQLDLSGDAPWWYRRVSYRVEQERGLADGGRISISFQPAYQALRLHHVDVWRDGVRQDRSGSIATQMLRREDDLDAGILDGRRTLSITIPDLRVGDRIDYDFSVVGANPVFGDDYYDVYSAAYGSAVALRQVGVRYPAAMPLHWKVTRDGYATRQGREGALRTLDLRARDLPAVRVEDRVPDSYDGYGGIEFSTAADWGEVARWANALYPVGFRDREVAARMVEQLALHDDDKQAVLLRAIGFVQGEIRYTALDLGTNSHAPYPPELVLQRRFGDCKDKALLLASLLAEAGIASEPVLVDTDGDDALAGRLPSAAAFDHVVLRAHVDGREVWVDATRSREHGPLGERSPLPFGQGLPVCARCDALVDIPAPMPARPEVDVGEHIALSERAGGFEAGFTVVTDYRNERAASVRSDFAYSPEEVGRNYLRYMRGFYDGLTSAAVPRAEDRGGGAGLRTFETYALDWDRSEATVFGVVLFQLLDFVPNLPKEPRDAPLALTGPSFARQVVRVDWPKGFSIKAARDEVATPWFRMVRDVRMVDGKLQVSAEWRRLARVVPAEDYALAQARLQAARDLLQYDIDLGGNNLARLFEDGNANLWALLALVLPALVLPGLWSLRRRSRFAAMLYAPRATMPAILADDRRGAMWAILIAWSLLDALLDHAGKFASHGVAAMLGAAALVAFLIVLRQLVFCWLLGVALRVLRTPRVEFDRLLAAIAWGGGPPMIVFMLLALLAARGDVTLFQKADDLRHAIPVVSAGLLVLAGYVWSVAGTVNAVSVAADVRRRRVVAALALLLVLAVLLVGTVFLLLR